MVETLQWSFIADSENARESKAQGNQQGDDAQLCTHKKDEEHEEDSEH